jgi:hypothetical protein
MTPYYLAPPLFLCLVLAARQPARRFAAAAVLSLEVTVFAYHHLHPWVWWPPVVASLGTIVALCYPGSDASVPPDMSGPSSAAPTQVSDAESASALLPDG